MEKEIGIHIVQIEVNPPIVEKSKITYDIDPLD